MADMSYQVFVALDATALEGGAIYIGAPNDDPETSPIQLYWDEAQTVPAPQPLRTSGGVIVRDGTPADVFASVQAYSIRVRDRSGSVVWYKPITGPNMAASRLTFPIPTGPASEVPGPANSTYKDLDSLKAAPQTNTSYTLVTADGRADYAFVPGDYTGKADDVGIVQLNGVPITTGALLRAGFTTVNVKDLGFGARGNFIQDDRPAIQKAIDYVFARGGGVVEIPTGTYKVSLYNPAGMFQLVGLIMRPGVYLRGQNRTGSVIKLNDNDAVAGVGAAIRIIASQPGPCDSMGLYDMGVDGNLPNQPKLAGQQGNGGNIVFGLFDNGVPSNIVIQNVASFNAYGQGIQVAGQSGNLGFNIRIFDCDVYQCSFIGIQVSQFIGLHIVQNKVALCGDNGIDIYGFNNNFSSPEVTSSRFTVAHNHIANCGGAGIFPETVRDGMIHDNIADGCIQCVQANNIGGTMHGVIVHNNEAINCQNGYAHTGAHTTRYLNNKARGFTYGGFVLGTVGGEASFASYDGFDFKPSSNLVALVKVPDGVMSVNFDDPGISNWVTQADVPNPTPRAKWFENFGGAATVGTRFPVFASGTEGTPNARLRAPVIDGRVEWSDPLPEYTDNASALAAIGPNRDYRRGPDGPTYRTYS